MASSQVPSSIFSINGFHVENSNLHAQNLFGGSSFLSNVTLKDIHFTNWKVSSEISIFSFFSMEKLLIRNISLNFVESSDPTDIKSILFEVQNLVLNKNYDALISDFSSENSSVTFIRFANVEKSTPTTAYVKFKNISFFNSNYTSEKALLTLEGILFDIDVQFSFTNLRFSKIKFSSKGFLMKLSHQLRYGVPIIDSTFNDIDNGYIWISTPDLQSTKLFTQVIMANVTANNIVENSVSFISLEAEGKLLVSNWKFTNMYSYSDGAVISGGDSKANVTITNSIFEKNTAQTGAVFSVSDESSIKWTNCTITNNYAITSGVISVTLSGFFEFYDSFLFNNYANNNPISQLLDSALLSTISNWSIHNNEALPKSEIIQEFTSSCTKLCFVNQNYIDFSIANFNVILSETVIRSLFQLISASLTITSQTMFHNQSSIANAFVSTVIFKDSSFINITLFDTGIQAVSSKLILENMTITNLQNPLNVNFILVILESTLQIINLNYTSSNSILFRARTSSVEIHGIEFNDILNATQLGEISNSYNISLDRITSFNTVISGQTLFSFSYCTNMSLSNINIQNAKTLVMKTVFSTVSLIDTIEIGNCSEGYIFINTIFKVKNSLFYDNGGKDILTGGALKIIDSVAVVENSTFYKNLAHSGGAIYFTCSSMALWGLSINNTIFNSNSATEKGGAIYYDYARPNFGSLVVFNNNSAIYGPNIASYAVKITYAEDSIKQLKITNLGSGIVLESNLNLALRDYDDQIMILDNVNQILLSSKNVTISQVGGFNSGTIYTSHFHCFI